jgi:hypothetical protein
MRNLLALLGVVLLAAGTTGWARGWYGVSFLQAEPGRVSFRVDVEHEKVLADLATAARSVLKAVSRSPQDGAAEPAK